ncbi:ATP-dependent DNA ligase [Cryobacterium serini]|uniref:ATP-dependent DNA ligase n=1 Tax=Cryobacterium serini TaxID=1259201 RepID=A0A4R9BSN9_9MICO|nr:ATP-dependent DNA ligase [Cryobacterium serini]TFD90155.1 ATP-dependent DNA ligase [Cryobacterium serini]
MGSLTYDRVVVEVDDRILSHLQLVIVQKLRRGESFLLSWQDSPSVGSGRSSVWLNQAIPLYFKYVGGHAATLNRQWIEELSRSANSAQGLVIVSEAGSLPVATLAARPKTTIDARTTAHTDTVLT